MINNKNLSLIKTYTTFLWLLGIFYIQRRYFVNKKMNSLFRLSIFVRCALEVRRCLLLLGLLFVVGHESGKALERVILLPVHVGVNFTIEADRYLLFGKALRDARSAAVRVIYGVAATFMVNASAERNFHQITSLFDRSPYICS
jgi:hypothetical protein